MKKILSKNNLEITTFNTKNLSKNHQRKWSDEKRLCFETFLFSFCGFLNIFYDLFYFGFSLENAIFYIPEIHIIGTFHF